MAGARRRDTGATGVIFTALYAVLFLQVACTILRAARPVVGPWLRPVRRARLARGPGNQLIQSPDATLPRPATRARGAGDVTGHSARGGR